MGVHVEGTSQFNVAQKITKFENGLKEDDAIKYAISAKTEWNALPAANQTFDSFYNIFSRSMTKYRTMSKPDENRSSRISNMNTGRGRGRGRSGCGRGQGRGTRRRGRGGGGSRYNPYSMTRPYGNNFTAEARIYPREQWNYFSDDQRNEVHDLKVKDGWINGQTPPQGFELNNDGYAIPTTRLVSAVQQFTSRLANNVPLPPAPNAHAAITPPPDTVPPVVDTNARQAGATFGRQGSRIPPSNDTQSVGSISAVSINGRSYSGAVYDSAGNRLA